MNRLPSSGTDHNRFREGLREICGDSHTHALFLNMLSLLEHIGSRKIMLARARTSEGEVLKHLAEEARHAFFFKRAAEKLAGRALGYGPVDTLAGAAARLYMNRLDARVSHCVESSLPYL